MKILEPFTIPLESINLIEASAGTGKSWTVTLLYLRLILEKNLTVDQILLVTFTDAATKELRDDIRNRLIMALAAFEDDAYSNEDEYSKLIASTGDNKTDRQESIRRLNRARLSLDEAAIFTIHGFCQRALSENSFEAGLPFESELLDDDRELMQKLTDDFWRREFFNAPTALLFKLQQTSITPDSLLKDIYSAVGKPYLEILGPKTTEASPEQWVELDALFKQAISTWKRSRDEIIALLQNPELDVAYNKVMIKSRDVVFSAMDMYANLDSLPSSLEPKTIWLGTKEKTTAKFASLEHPIFQQWQDFLDCWGNLNNSADDFINQIRIRLLHYLQEALPKEKSRLGVLSFDDLLLQLQKALNAKPELAQGLQQKYKAALIDEFQDTDPIQYDIFNKIFANQQGQSNHAVFLVGDPKQAIYSFRGGDIHTYLKAKSDTDEKNHYTLKTNWRSHPDLISAYNTLYLPTDNPFQDKGISYVKVDAGDIVTDQLVTPDQRSPLSFWKVEANDSEGGVEGVVKKSATIIREEVAHAVAGDIATLLNAAQKGEAKIGDKAITGGDIAILIRSHAQGDLIKRALSARAIPSVQSSKHSIFQTHEAGEMRHLLTAIADPQREDNIRRALATELMGYNANDLLGFEDNSDAWESILVAMQTWHHQWQKKGFLPMMRDLMRSEKMHQQLLAYENGERRLTNVLHLSEIIHHQSRKQAFSMEEVLRWLQQQQNASLKEAELRLESDEKLVKIVTIHKSKGLEYPIVYCPFVGISNKATNDSIFIFHHDEKTCLEVGSTKNNDNKKIKAEEERAENTRLLYVALTRAKYQCTVACIPEAISGTPDRSALGWLLTDGLTIQSGSSKAVKEKNADYYQVFNQRLETLSQESRVDVIDLPLFEENMRYQPIETEQVLIARNFTATIKQQAQITSFSGLTAGAHAETPDYDADPERQALPIIKEDEFPRGPTAGTALHEIFEFLDFSVPMDEQSNVISDILNKWSFDEIHEKTATTLINNSLHTELFDGFSLQQLSKVQRLDEMEFFLPLNRLQVDDLKQILFKHLPTDWQVVRNAVDTLYFEQIEGYLKGYIDLIFEHQNKYYVVDYKSNTLVDYTQASLLNTMADSHYYLQYLLYSVALHRYLKKRVPDYSWEMHMGGAYYLFIRGMSGNVKNQSESSDTNEKEEKIVKKGGGGYIDVNEQGNDLPPRDENKQSGVFFHKPDIALIEAMDGLFMESML